MSARKTSWRRRLGVALAGVVVVAFLMLVVLIHEGLKPARRNLDQSPTTVERQPLTDIAGRPRRPAGPMPSLPDDPRPAPDLPVAPEVPPIPPGAPGGEIAGPSAPSPQWTEPMAMPGPPRPPDPFEEPALAQDPDRGRTAGATD